MRDKLLLFVCLCLGIASTAQENLFPQWNDYFSYSDIQDMQLVNNTLYVAAANSVYILNQDTNEVRRLSTLQGLSGDAINAIYFSEATDDLFIGHPDGLLEIYNVVQDQIRVEVEIRDKPSIAPNVKAINHFNEHDDIVYIATDFGIVLYDLTIGDFGDTLFPAPGNGQLRVGSTGVFLDHLWLSATGFGGDTPSGIFYAPLSSNLLIANNWTRRATEAYTNNIVTAQGYYTIATSKRLIQFPDLTGVAGIGPFTTIPNDVATDQQNILLLEGTSAFILDQDLNELQEITNLTGYEDAIFQAGAIDGDQIYLGTDRYGVLQLNRNNTFAVNQIFIDGPLSNDIFNVDASPDQVWAVFGDYDQTYNAYPLKREGVSQFTNGAWNNIQRAELPTSINLTSVVTLPNEPNRTFVTSFFDGALEFVDGVPVNFFNEDNSTLESLVLPGVPTYRDLRVDNITYTPNNQLWFTNGVVNNLLKFYDLDTETWGSVDFSNFIVDPFETVGFADLASDAQSRLYVASFQDGVLGYDPSTGTYNSIGRGPGNGGLPESGAMNALAIDQNNVLWIGAATGLRILSNAGRMFSEESPQAQPIIIEDETSGVPRELFGEIPITDIIVDGSNNKWVSTATSGVFYISPNGDETLLRFTKNNSPLPSDIVLDMDLVDETGEIFFATPNGLVSFNGNTVSKPQEDLSGAYVYPNPVRPGYEGNVVIDGLTDRARVKITDISGNLVFDGISNGGALTWDTSAFGRHKVATGTYLVFIATDDGIETQMRKVLIVR